MYFNGRRFGQNGVGSGERIETLHQQAGAAHAAGLYERTTIHA